jgi:chromosome segregation ATPase
VIPLTKEATESINSEESRNLDLENVTDSWVDRHSLLQKEMQAALNLEREKLESPTGNPLVTFASSGSMKKEAPKYMRSMNPLKWMSKLFKTESEKQKILNKKREKQGLKKGDKEGGSISTRNYPMKNEIRYNSYSYRFEKKSIFSMPHLGLFAEKYKLKPKNDKGKIWGSYMKNRKSKNFIKKNKEFKDEISGKEEKKRMKEELVKGKRKEKIKAVQSMCTSAIQNITDSNLVILKTRSGQEIKTKKCLDEVKQILKEFRKDLKTKQSRMRENNEDILELRCSVKRLESDIKEAQRVSGKQIDTRAKEAAIEYKTAQIKSLEETNNTLFDEIKNLTSQIEDLKRENENNLKEVTKVVKRKFREIESRNKHERQMQKDIILKYNVELESKNSEINELIGRYQEMRLLNEDLSREISQVKKNKKRSKSTIGEGKQKKFNFMAQANIQRKKSRSRLAEEQLARRINISESAIMKLISNFEESLRELEEELRNEGLRVEKLAKEKEETKKQLYNLEKRLSRKKKEYQQSKGRGDLKNQLIQLEVTKSNKSKSLESKHRMLKTRKDMWRKAIATVENVKTFGKKMIHSTKEQIRSIMMFKEELKKKENVIQDYLKKEKILGRVNELKEEKLSNKTTVIEKLNSRISILENELAKNKKFRIIRDKSSHSKKEFMIRKTKKNHSTNNFETFTKKKLYHHSNKTGSHTNFYSNNKFMSETLGSIKSKTASFQ